jgi:hypothetical protein
MASIDSGCPNIGKRTFNTRVARRALDCDDRVKRMRHSTLALMAVNSPVCACAKNNEVSKSGSGRWGLPISIPLPYFAITSQKTIARDDAILFLES